MPNTPTVSTVVLDLDGTDRELTEAGAHDVVESPRDLVERLSTTGSLL